MASYCNSFASPPMQPPEDGAVWTHRNPPPDRVDYETREIKQAAFRVLSSASQMIMHATAANEPLSRTRMRFLMHLAGVPPPTADPNSPATGPQPAYDGALRITPERKHEAKRPDGRDDDSDDSDDLMDDEDDDVFHFTMGQSTMPAPLPATPTLVGRASFEPLRSRPLQIPLLQDTSENDTEVSSAQSSSLQSRKDSLADLQPETETAANTRAV